MQQAQAFLAKHKIPATSPTRAIQFMNDKGYGEMSIGDHTSMVQELTGLEFVTNDPILARYTLFYAVQNSIQQQDMPGAELFDVAVSSARELIEKNSWVRVQAENADAAPRKGGKKEQAQALWAAKKDDGLTRKQWIELLVKEIDLTPAGASTYYANMKAGRF